MILAPLPPVPGRDQAREAAERELQRRAYDEARPPLVTRAVNWLVDKLEELLDKATGVPGGRIGVLLIALLVAGLVALVVLRLRPTMRSAHSDALFDLDEPRSSDDHRRRAEAAAARGDHADAVRERLRAIVRQLEERGVLDARPGRTAEEVVAEVAAQLPGMREPLHRGVTVFEEVWYGGRSADAHSYAELVEVDTAVSGQRAGR